MNQETLYHIYNQGNNREPIFFEEKNYIYFLRKVRKHLLPHLHILGYCLMPNHFHFLAFTKTHFDYQKYATGLRVLLSSYTKAINKQEKRSGSLFRQNTKFKNISDANEEYFYGQYCLHYIHQNPLRAGLVSKIEEWRFSSYPDYIKIRNGSICNKELAVEILRLPKDTKEFINLSKETVPDNVLANLI